MSYFPSELEILRDNVERIDRTLEQSEDLQRALYAASDEYYRQQLLIGGDTMAEQGRIADEIADVGAEITTGLSYVEARLERIAEVQRSGLREIVGTIEALGPLFQWGFDQVVCQIAMAGEDIR